LGNIGLLAEADGRLDAAAGYYERAIAIAEQVHPVFALLPDFLAKLGAVLVKMARYGEARTALTRAVSLIDEGFALSPSRQGTILTLLGDLDRREGHFDEARRTLDRAMALFDGLAPDNPERFPAYLFLGLLERDCQRYQRAVSLLEMAQSVAASTPDAAAQAGLDLARVLWSRASPGDRNRARSLVKVARQYFRDHPDEADNDERDTDSWLAQHAPELGAAN